MVPRAPEGDAGDRAGRRALEVVGADLCGPGHGKVPGDVDVHPGARRVGVLHPLVRRDRSADGEGLFILIVLPMAKPRKGLLPLDEIGIRVQLERHVVGVEPLTDERIGDGLDGRVDGHPLPQIVRTEAEGDRRIHPGHRAALPAPDIVRLGRTGVDRRDAHPEDAVLRLVLDVVALPEVLARFEVHVVLKAGVGGLVRERIGADRLLRDAIGVDVDQPQQRARPAERITTIGRNVAPESDPPGLRLDARRLDAVPVLVRTPPVDRCHRHLAEATEVVGHDLPRALGRIHRPARIRKLVPSAVDRCIRRGVPLQRRLRPFQMLDRRLADNGRVLDTDQVVLHLAVRSQACDAQTAHRTEAEAGKRLAGHRPGGDVEQQHVASRGQRLVGEHVLVGVIPVAVGVPVDPGVERAARRGGHLDRRGLADDQIGEDHAILVIGAAEVVSCGAGVRQPLELTVDEPAEVDFGNDCVAGAVAEQQRRVCRIRGVAEIRVAGALVRTACDDEGQIERSALVPVGVRIGDRKPSEARVLPDRAVLELEFLPGRAPSERVLAGLRRDLLDDQPVDHAPSLDEQVLCVVEADVVLVDVVVIVVLVELAGRIEPALADVAAGLPHIVGVRRDLLAPEQLARPAPCDQVVGRQVGVDACREAQAVDAQRGPDVIEERAPEVNVGDRAVLGTLEIVGQRSSGRSHVEPGRLQIGRLRPVHLVGVAVLPVAEHQRLFDVKQVVFGLPVGEDPVAVPALRYRRLTDREPRPDVSGQRPDAEIRGSQLGEISVEPSRHREVHQHVLRNSPFGALRDALPEAVVVPVEQDVDVGTATVGPLVVHLDIELGAPDRQLTGIGDRFDAGEDQRSDDLLAAHLRDGIGARLAQTGVPVLETLILVVGVGRELGALSAVAVRLDIHFRPEVERAAVVLDPRGRTDAHTRREHSQYAGVRIGQRTFRRIAEIAVPRRRRRVLAQHALMNDEPFDAHVPAANVDRNPSWAVGDLRIRIDERRVPHIRPRHKRAALNQLVLMSKAADVARQRGRLRVGRPLGLRPVQ